MLSSAVTDLLLNDNRARHMGTIGREIVRQEFSISKMVSEYLALYDIL